MRRVQLTKQIMRVLSPALVHAKATIKREIESGISSLYQSDNSSLFFVLRPEGRELVVVAAAGAGLKESRQEVINFAIENNFKSIRYHTKYPERLMKGLKGLPVRLIEIRRSLFGRDELVYKMRLNYGTL